MNFFNKMNNIIFQFIPIISIFIYAAYPKNLVKFSKTILGKAVAIGIIVYYSLISKLYGALACGIIILLYQNDYIEGFDEINQFKAEHCNEGKLMHNNMNVNIEMSEHVFPEIKYKNKVCNPCDDSCEYDFIEKKLEIQEKMVPQNSNDWTDKIIASLSNIPFNPKKSKESNAEYFSKYN